MCYRALDLGCVLFKTPGTHEGLDLATSGEQCAAELTKAG